MLKSIASVGSGLKSTPLVLCVILFFIKYPEIKYSIALL